MSKYTHQGRQPKPNRLRRSQGRRPNFPINGAVRQCQTTARYDMETKETLRPDKGLGFFHMRASRGGEALGQLLLIGNQSGRPAFSGASRNSLGRDFGTLLFILPRGPHAARGFFPKADGEPSAQTTAPSASRSFGLVADVRTGFTPSKRTCPEAPWLPVPPLKFDRLNVMGSEYPISFLSAISILGNSTSNLAKACL
jgi:hypothetical protein